MVNGLVKQRSELRQTLACRQSELNTLKRTLVCEAARHHSRYPWRAMQLNLDYRPVVKVDPAASCSSALSPACGATAVVVEDLRGKSVLHRPTSQSSPVKNSVRCTFVPSSAFQFLRQLLL